MTKKCLVIEDGVQCTKGARSGYDTCTKHGGGKRCLAIEDGVQCTKGAISGYDTCTKHGGGIKCAYQSCDIGVHTNTSRYFSDNDVTIVYCAHHFRVMFPDHIKSTYSKEQIVAEYLDAYLPQHKFVHNKVLLRPVTVQITYSLI